ncbi:hypothetical protein RSOLAG22IIIB_05650 [Rhizoctonia solani]|uniref:Uncharacterized protein n=1 Tax=Rhizoctonia solani TaxID=456999 RepID=A0A0K6G7S4_9AGAM|nr:hypothetical protein RSOLAG22IIIB_05650 [Rhizoctonia solani]
MSSSTVDSYTPAQCKSPPVNKGPIKAWIFTTQSAHSPPAFAIRFISDKQIDGDILESKLDPRNELGIMSGSPNARQALYAVTRVFEKSHSYPGREIHLWMNSDYVKAGFNKIGCYGAERLLVDQPKGQHVPNYDIWKYLLKLCRKQQRKPVIEIRPEKAPIFLDMSDLIQRACAIPELVQLRVKDRDWVTATNGIGNKVWQTTLQHPTPVSTVP